MDTTIGTYRSLEMTVCCAVRIQQLVTFVVSIQDNRQWSRNSNSYQMFYPFRRTEIGIKTITTNFCINTGQQTVV